MLMKAASGFKDLCFNKTIAFDSSPVISSTVSKFGGKSFDCRNGYIFIGGVNDFNFSKTDEFVMEFWTLPTTVTTNQWFLGKGTATTSCLKTTSGTNDLYLQNQGQAAFIGAPSALTSGVWQHVAIEQYNGTLKAYFGGVAKLSINVTAGFGATLTDCQWVADMALAITAKGTSTKCGYLRSQDTRETSFHRRSLLASTKKKAT